MPTLSYRAFLPGRLKHQKRRTIPCQLAAIDVVGGYSRHKTQPQQAVQSRAVVAVFSFISRVPASHHVKYSARLRSRSRGRSNGGSLTSASAAVEMQRLQPAAMPPVAVNVKQSAISRHVAV